ncbi:hypothetical protein DQ384_24495 [Sphaerisporangium album]|uniref:Uncharacterized protein n=1 Tax=Sphaerisporangium album TaxID=509200 RepID=A0A367FD43_9ACTN|nr:hypothetical protein DQ384_24495 [Sphaerisporangium album]
MFVVTRLSVPVGRGEITPAPVGRSRVEGGPDRSGRAGNAPCRGEEAFLVPTTDLRTLSRRLTVVGEHDRMMAQAGRT